MGLYLPLISTSYDNYYFSSSQNTHAKNVFPLSMSSLLNKNYIISFLLFSPMLQFRARIPVASAVTALEIWLLACILLVFGALAEYAFILRQVINLTRKQRRMRQRMQDQGQNMANYNSPPAVFAPGASLTSNSTGLGTGGGRNGSSLPKEEWPLRSFNPSHNATHNNTGTDTSKALTFKIIIFKMQKLLNFNLRWLIYFGNTDQ